MCTQPDRQHAHTYAEQHTSRQQSLKDEYLAAPLLGPGLLLLLFACWENAAGADSSKHVWDRAKKPAAALALKWPEGVPEGLPEKLHEGLPKGLPEGFPKGSPEVEK